MTKKFIMTLLVGLALVPLGGCRSRRAVQSPSVEAELVVGTSRQQKELIAEARRWLGTPYVYGGNSRRGTDCSGMVMEIFQFVYDIKLPRSSAMQQKYARPIDFDDLKPGDLVFFATGGKRRVSHVGLYVGHGRMIHASASRGVMESDLDEKYWRRTLHSQGRVVDTDSKKKKKKQKKPKREATAEEAKNLQELYDALDAQIDSIYVSNPEIFD